MDQRLSVITVGVKDLKKSLSFYKEILGWVPAASSNDHIIFFQIGGLVFSLYSEESLSQEVYGDKKNQRVSQG